MVPTACEGVDRVVSGGGVAGGGVYVRCLYMLAGVHMVVAARIHAVHVYSLVQQKCYQSISRSY